MLLLSLMTLATLRFQASVPSPDGVNASSCRCHRQKGRTSFLGWPLASRSWTGAPSSPPPTAARTFLPWGRPLGAQRVPSPLGYGARGLVTLPVSSSTCCCATRPLSLALSAVSMNGSTWHTPRNHMYATAGSKINLPVCCRVSHTCAHTLVTVSYKAPIHTSPHHVLTH